MDQRFLEHRVRLLQFPSGCQGVSAAPRVDCQGPGMGEDARPLRETLDQAISPVEVTDAYHGLDVVTLISETDRLLDADGLQRIIRRGVRPVCRGMVRLGQLEKAQD